MKECVKCHIIKNESEYYKNIRNKSGIANICSYCDNKQSKEYYKNHREHALQRGREYLKTSRGRALVRIKGRRMYHKEPDRNSIRSRTRLLVKKGLIVKKPCEICGEINVQAHHTDYSDAINVHWYCPYHHRVIEGKSII